MLSYLQALEKIKIKFSQFTLQKEETDIFDSLNRILAEDIISDVDLPPFDNSAMDGYAIKFSDRNNWNIIGEITAGNYSSLDLKIDEAVLITTGSKIPSGVDLVIPIEDVIVDGNLLALKKNIILNKRKNIRKQGNDLMKGETAIEKFTKVDAKVMAVLASCGKEKVKVFQKLKAAVFATGDELVSIKEKPNEDKIRVSNIYSIIAAVKELNQLVINLGFTKDDKEIIRQKIKDALQMDIDLLITTGGVSVGKYDFLKEIFNEEGVEEIFWRVNIKPGKPIYFGVYQKKEKNIFVFGLPGNPVSALVTFYMFIKPAIDFIFKQKSGLTILASLQNDLKKSDEKRHFARGILFFENGLWKVTSEFSQSSGNLVEMSKANCLIVIEEERNNPLKGEIVECIII